MSEVIDNKYVVFKLCKEYYGVPINKVISIEKMQESTRIPNAPNYVKGVINLRGEVISLIDLRLKFNMEPKEMDNNSRIIIVSNDDIVAGLIVDSSSEVIEINKEDIDAPPTSYENEYLYYIQGIGKIKDKLVILLELSKVFEN
ncbi:purine-binding chemotaxis protein CheW [Tissierella praeacuta DSM 18095]|uniref:Purine-binding chemotaxis protein CheW n=1 Tax=Tissierella praeacuta DSM 18095 TaxID=1123404 RepID=A0A1M4SJX1_9FIRM|nr:chemotaxis protein CheW [Tissierella praeacuta]TCU72676.1 purine-binding chemotaxis protein CheW [Tissierella praeacuta]SHE32564.1 purine-binding chemotaxis protein CheW [Tissierella praeacuta DSM 18095]SUP01507.1 Chemotaxis protein CheW [Tissierella praeacuta]